ncbi:MAG: hypothetical protein IJD72_07795 [Alistipes sp.]|nr:hypothetical protein [Alistipes sp.]
MAYRKIFIAVDCKNEAEVEAVQQFAKELSQAMQLKSADVLRLAPAIRKNRDLLTHTIRSIASDGMKGVMKSVPYFISNFKK